MSHRTRREFLGNVGRGMLVASVGYNLAVDMGLAPAWAADAKATEGQDLDQLSFGELEPLVTLLQETPPATILPILVEKIQSGLELKTLISAGALANARGLGGQNYVGYHTMMAMGPAYMMSQELPQERAALPVLKVLYRNAGLMSGRAKEVLHPVKPAELSKEQTAAVLRESVQKGDVKQAEQALAAAVARSPADAYNDLLETVEDGADVHRVVLAHRAWDMLNLTGPQYAETMLRQSVRYCVDQRTWTNRVGNLSTLLPKLFDQYKLAGRSAGTREGDDAWVEHLSKTIFTSNREQAAEAVAAALGEGFSHKCIAEAVSLAANQLLLRDIGRTEKSKRADAPLGAVHGDSIGVHACDSANAWRHIALVSNPRNSMAALIVSGLQVAFDRIERGGDFLQWEPRPTTEQIEKVAQSNPTSLLAELDNAIREQNQELSCALVHRYGQLDAAPRPIFDLLIKYACSEEGSLHAEKFYRTATDEFANTRPAFRWRQIVGLARVTASEYGRTAAGYEQACKLLKL